MVGAGIMSRQKQGDDDPPCQDFHAVRRNPPSQDCDNCDVLRRNPQQKIKATGKIQDRLKFSFRSLICGRALDE